MIRHSANSIEAAIIVCTYQRPRNLKSCLISIAAQTGVDGQFELVVADDGSNDETADLVSEFQRRVDFPVRFTAHEHDGFHPARCRNEGVLASNAPYLLFLDGDCVIPRDHVRNHLAQRRPTTVCGGDCFRLTEEQSDRVAGGVDGREELERLVPLRERWRVTRNHLDAKLNWLLRNPSKPKLFAGNIGMWRRDLELVNGFDQKFLHWGGEDDDLRMRLIQAGLTIRSIRDRAHTFHLWHPPDPTVPARWVDGRNAQYLQRRFRLTRCIDGLLKRRTEDLSIRIRNGSRFQSLIAEGFPFLREPAATGERVDVECLFLPGEEGFTGAADCNLLILTAPAARPPLDDTHVLVTDLASVVFDSGPRFRMSEIHRIWESIL